MANKHIKRASTSLIVKEIQIEITMRYHFTQVGSLSLKNQKTTSADGMWRN